MTLSPLTPQPLSPKGRRGVRKNHHTVQQKSRRPTLGPPRLAIRKNPRANVLRIAIPSPFEHAADLPCSPGITRAAPANCSAECGRITRCLAFRAVLSGTTCSTRCALLKFARLPPGKLVPRLRRSWRRGRCGKPRMKPLFHQHLGRRPAFELRRLHLHPGRPARWALALRMAGQHGPQWESVHHDENSKNGFTRNAFWTPGIRPAAGEVRGRLIAADAELPEQHERAAAGPVIWQRWRIRIMSRRGGGIFVLVALRLGLGPTSALLRPRSKPSASFTGAIFAVVDIAVSFPGSAYRFGAGLCAAERNRPFRMSLSPGYRSTKSPMQIKIIIRGTLHLGPPFIDRGGMGVSGVAPPSLTGG